MVMGPTHAMSGAAVWLTGAAFGATWAGSGSIPVAIAGAAIMGGASLLPDIDSPGSLSTRDGATAVRAFGVVGEAIGHSMNAVSVVVYNLTATRKDGTRTHGHRTLTHTLVFAILASVLVALGAGSSKQFTLMDHTWTIGKAFTFVLMWAMLHLALFGLFEKWTKKQREKYTLAGVMIVSLGMTLATILMLPATGYPWLGLCVGGGVLVHTLGDAITKQGSPLLWPIRIRGKNWYEITLPSLFRIRAGGTFEYAVLLPVLTLVVTTAAVGLTDPGKLLLTSVWTEALSAARGVLSF